MLLSVRENLKNKVVFGLVIFIMLVMVLGGVGSVNLGSIGGNSVAEVGSEEVSAVELDRAVEARKNQLLNNGTDPTSDFVQDANLRQQILPQLIRQKALLSGAKSGLIGASQTAINEAILQQEQFQTDGKFDEQVYRRLLRANGFTPASYKIYLENQLILSQQSSGMLLSSFLTEKELALYGNILNQTRSFFQITIPKSKAGENIAVSQEEIAQYYQENQVEFNVAAKLSVDYIEVSLDQIAKTIQVSDDELKAQHEADARAFEANAEFDIAHILINDSENNAEKIAQLQSKIAEEIAFDELAKEFSDDPGNKELGGALGVMTPGIFPKPFEDAVYMLDTGQISSPVVTDAGTHFIKVLNKSVPQIDSFDDRKEAIRKSIQRIQAEPIFVDLLAELEEMTFGDKPLEPIAEQLGLPLVTSDFFEKDTGSGIADIPAVRNAAYDIDVLDNGNNSQVVEVSNARSLVLRKNEYKPEHIDALENVTARITETLREKKTQEALQAIALDIQSKIDAGGAASAVAESSGFELKEFSSIKQSELSVEPAVIRKVFEMAYSAAKTQFENISNAAGDRVLIGLTEVEAGSFAESSQAEISALTSQIQQANAVSESSAYESTIIDELVK